jgi:hypothetical protein
MNSMMSISLLTRFTREVAQETPEMILSLVLSVSAIKVVSVIWGLSTHHV